VPGLAVVIPYRALLFDGGFIDDSLRRLTSVDVGSKRNGFEFRKLFIEEKRKDVGGQRGVNVVYSHIEEQRRRQTLVCRLI
jgi:hypothetical protein